MSRVLLLSDIHGNLPALEAVLSDVGGFDEVWVLGDLVDYGPWPGEVIDLVRSLQPRVAVRGNHDHAAAYGVDCGCGPRTWRASVESRRLITMPRLSRADREYLSGLPQSSRPAGWILAVHGSPRSPLHGYLYHDPEAIEKEVRSPSRLRLDSSGRPLEGLRLLVHGHTHQPGVYEHRGLLLVNPGSVGQPRDGDPRAGYAVLELDGDVIVGVRLFRVEYDVGRVVGEIRGLGLPGWLEEWLTYTFTTGRIP